MGDGRHNLFGKAVNGEMCLNRYGEVVREEWLRSAEIRREIDLDFFVVMPNHIHGIVVIAGDVQTAGGRARKWEGGGWLG